MRLLERGVRDPRAVKKNPPPGLVQTHAVARGAKREESRRLVRGADQIRALGEQTRAHAGGDRQQRFLRERQTHVSGVQRRGRRVRLRGVRLGAVTRAGGSRSGIELGPGGGGKARARQVTARARLGDRARRRGAAEARAKHAENTRGGARRGHHRDLGARATDRQRRQICFSRNPSTETRNAS